MKNIARVILILAGMIWGFGFIGNKFLLDHGWTDLQLLFVRFVTAFLFLFLFFFKRMVTANKNVIKQGIKLGTILFGGFFFQTWGLEHTTASNNAIITAGYIVMLPLAVFLMERTKVPRSTVLAAFITMAGIILISFDFQTLTVAFGDVLTFVATIFWTLHIYLLSHQSRKHDLIVLLGYQLLTFSILITTIVLLTDGLPALSGDPADYTLWIYGMILGVFASFVAFLLQTFGQKHTNPAEAGILISTESVFGPIFAILFYQEPFSWLLLIGMILVFVGIVISETGGTIRILIPLRKVKKQNQ